MSSFFWDQPKPTPDTLHSKRHVQIDRTDQIDLLALTRFPDSSDQTGAWLQQAKNRIALAKPQLASLQRVQRVQPLSDELKTPQSEPVVAVDKHPKTTGKPRRDSSSVSQGKSTSPPSKKKERIQHILIQVPEPIPKQPKERTTNESVSKKKEADEFPRPPSRSHSVGGRNSSDCAVLTASTDKSSGFKSLSSISGSTGNLQRQHRRSSAQAQRTTEPVDAPSEPEPEPDEVVHRAEPQRPKERFKVVGAEDTYSSLDKVRRELGFPLASELCPPAVPDAESLVDPNGLSWFEQFAKAPKCTAAPCAACAFKAPFFACEKSVAEFHTGYPRQKQPPPPPPPSAAAELDFGIEKDGEVHESVVASAARLQAEYLATAQHAALLLEKFAKAQRDANLSSRRTSFTTSSLVRSPRRTVNDNAVAALRDTRAEFGQFEAETIAFTRRKTRLESQGVTAWAKRNPAHGYFKMSTSSSSPVLRDLSERSVGDLDKLDTDSIGDESTEDESGSSSKTSVFFSLSSPGIEALDNGWMVHDIDGERNFDPAAQTMRDVAAGRATAAICREDRTLADPFKLLERHPVMNAENYSLGIHKGKKFMRLYDGSGAVFWPSGRPAISISSTATGKYFWAYSDGDDGDSLRVYFSPHGYGAVNWPDGTLRAEFSSSTCTVFTSSGAVESRASWSDFQFIKPMELASGMFLTVKGKSEIVLQFGCVGNNYKVNFVSPSGRLRGSNQQSAEVLKVASVLHEGYEAKANWLLEKMYDLTNELARASLSEVPQESRRYLGTSNSSITTDPSADGLLLSSKRPKSPRKLCSAGKGRGHINTDNAEGVQPPLSATSPIGIPKELLAMLAERSARVATEIPGVQLVPLFSGWTPKKRMVGGEVFGSTAKSQTRSLRVNAFVDGIQNTTIDTRPTSTSRRAVNLTRPATTQGRRLPLEPTKIRPSTSHGTRGLLDSPIAASYGRPIFSGLDPKKRSQTLPAVTSLSRGSLAINNGRKVLDVDDIRLAALQSGLKTSQLLVLLVTDESRNSTRIQSQFDKVYMKVRAEQTSYFSILFAKYSTIRKLGHAPPALVEKHLVTAGMLLMYCAKGLVFARSVTEIDYQYFKRSLAEAKASLENSRVYPANFSFSAA